MKKIIFFFSIMLFSAASSQVQKVEPPFWWSGMQDSKVQLLLYGKNIADLHPEISGGVRILEVKKVENPNYLFVTIDTQNVQPETVSINLKRNSKSVQKLSYDFKKRKDNSANRAGFNSSDVIYLIMPDRFANGNPKNDSHPDVFEKANRSDMGGRHGGDLEGVIQNLDYIHELGATTLWMTPATEDNERTYSYHGYAASDLYKMDPRYGTNEDFKKLSAELHKRGMKHIIDFVPNHWGLHHWLIQDLPAKDWIHVWEDGEKGFKRSNYRQTTQFDLYASQIDKLGNENGWFDTTMPDMNDSNPLVVNYLVQNAIWWTEFADLDGIRVDTYPYNSKKGITEWATRVMNEYPNFNIMGEILMHSPVHTSYWQKNSKVGAIENFNSNLPTVMDFPLHDILAMSINETEASWDKGLIRIYDLLSNDFLYPNINSLLTLVGNHDVNRINEEFDGDVDKYKLAITLIGTMRGIPQIYYGDEIGMRGKKSIGDGDIRQDFPGGWKGDAQNAFTESGRTVFQKSYFDYTKKLLNFRKSSKALQTGKTLHYAPENNVYVYFRYTDSESVMVVVNNSKETQTLDLKRFSEGLKNFTKGKDIISDHDFDLKNTLSVPAKSSLILELK